MQFYLKIFRIFHTFLIEILFKPRIPSFKHSNGFLVYIHGVLKYRNTSLVIFISDLEMWEQLYFKRIGIIVQNFLFCTSRLVNVFERKKYRMPCLKVKKEKPVSEM